MRRATAGQPTTVAGKAACLIPGRVVQNQWRSRAHDGEYGKVEQHQKAKSGEGIVVA